MKPFILSLALFTLCSCHHSDPQPPEDLSVRMLSSYRLPSAEQPFGGLSIQLDARDSEGNPSQHPFELAFNQSELTCRQANQGYFRHGDQLDLSPLPTALSGMPLAVQLRAGKDHLMAEGKYTPLMPVLMVGQQHLGEPEPALQNPVILSPSATAPTLIQIALLDAFTGEPVPVDLPLRLEADPHFVFAGPSQRSTQAIELKQGESQVAIQSNGDADQFGLLHLYYEQQKVGEVVVITTAADTAELSAITPATTTVLQSTPLSIQGPAFAEVTIASNLLDETVVTQLDEHGELISTWTPESAANFGELSIQINDETLQLHVQVEDQITDIAPEPSLEPLELSLSGGVDPNMKFVIEPVPMDYLQGQLNVRLQGQPVAAADVISAELSYQQSGPAFLNPGVAGQPVACAFDPALMPIEQIVRVNIAEQSDEEGNVPFVLDVGHIPAFNHLFLTLTVEMEKEGLTGRHELLFAPSRLGTVPNPFGPGPDCLISTH